MSEQKSDIHDQIAPLTQDRLFDILSNGRRRFILQYLASTEESVKQMDLVTATAAWEYDTPREALTRTEKKRMYVSLHQTHLPRLSRAGLIDYDTERNVVAPGPEFDTVNPYLDAEGAHSNWRRYYLLLTVINAGILSSSVLASSAAFSEFLLLPFIPISYTALAIAHFIVTSRRTNNLGRLVRDGHGL